MQSCPAPDSEVEDPESLRTTLMPHQRRALAWALWRETQVPSGGILGKYCIGLCDNSKTYISISGKHFISIVI